MLVLGAGPGGYSAAFRSADLGMKTVLVERYATLGGVCLNVGCIPSKALLHIAAVMDEVAALGEHGVAFGAPKVDLAKLLAWKNKVVGKLTGGLTGHGQVAQGRGRARLRQLPRSASRRGRSDGRTPDRTRPAPRRSSASRRRSSQPGRSRCSLPFVPDDPRIVDSTGALELHAVPKRMLVVGGGIIGLEMGTVYSTPRRAARCRRNARRPDAGRRPRPGQGLGEDEQAALRSRHAQDQDGRGRGEEGRGLRHASKASRHPPARSPTIWCCWPSAAARTARRSAPTRPASPSPIAASSPPTTSCAPTCRTSSRSATSSASRCSRTRRCTKATSPPKPRPVRSRSSMPASFRRSPTPTRKSRGSASPRTRPRPTACKVQKGLFPWAASGRAIANGRDEGFTKLLFDADTHRIVGGGIVGTHAGDLISELALAIEMGADAVDIGKTIHPHPTLGESIGLAAEAFEGVCTDLPHRAQESMTQDEQKQLVAREAIRYVVDRCLRRRRQRIDREFFHRRAGRHQEPHQGRRCQLGAHRRAPESAWHSCRRAERSRSPARVHRRRRRSHRARRDDQGRRRRADARKDRRVRRRKIRVHRRRVEAGRRAR